MTPETQVTTRQLMVPEPIQVPPTAHLCDVVALMNERRIGAVLVSEEARLCGIFTERDLLRMSCRASDNWRDLPISEWMTPDPYTVEPDADWEKAMRMMDQLRVRHLPVVEDGRLIGIVSARQLIGRREEHLNGMITRRTAELKSAIDELMARDAETASYMRSAARLQQRLMLPHQPPNWPEVDWAVRYLPLDPLGGDYYDFAQPDDDHLGVLIADASGHGIPAALMAVLAWVAFERVAHSTISPGEVLAAMNRQLQGMADERFVTAFYGVLNRKTGRFTYASAGHPPMLRVVGATGGVERLGARGFLLGIMPDEEYAEQTVQLEPGDRLCLFTDGVIESRNELGETFDTARLEAYLAANGKADAESIAEKFLVQLDEYRDGASAGDDVTLVIAELS